MRDLSGSEASGAVLGPLVKLRAPLPLDGRVERTLVSESGFLLMAGWLADEGQGPAAFRIVGPDLDLPLPADAVLRHARPDVEAGPRGAVFDYGFLAVAQAPAGVELRRPFTLNIRTAVGTRDVAVTPEVVSDRRLLDAALVLLAGVSAHGGAAVGLHRFAAGAAGGQLVGLFQRLVTGHVARCAIHRFRPRPVSRSFVTVLFGATEPVKLQPVLFRQAGIDVGEWIYVCNSPEDAEAVMRLGRLVSDLYDLPITVMVMPDNVGFGAANNTALAAAASDAIYVINPDVYPVPGHAGPLRAALDAPGTGTALRGGLLFYDAHTLMHAGMYVDSDRGFARRGVGAPEAAEGDAAVDLLRVEHFDKGVPFDERRWAAPLGVPAITGAVMAFARRPFQALGGFSTRYIYGHYEDADLSLRWAETHGPVMIDPRLRLIHLEGQGSRPRGEQYRAAAIFNRHLFTLRHGAAFARDPGPFTRVRSLGAAPEPR